MASSQAGRGERPLSPHLQVYRWPVTMATSITHRATGIALYAGSALLAVWLVSAAMGREAFEAVNGLYGSPIGLFVLFGYTWAIFYHMANGIRHLAWDAGVGFKLSTANATGVLVFALSAGLTLAAWGFGLALRAGS